MISVDFRIMGDDFNVDDVTKILEITPTDSWKIGDSIRNTGLKYKYTCWMYSTGYEDTWDLGVQLSKIEKIFFKKEDILKTLKRTLSLDYSIDIFVSMEAPFTPGMHFDSKFIKFAANIDAEIDIDTYVD